MRDGVWCTYTQIELYIYLSRWREAALVGWPGFDLVGGESATRYRYKPLYYIATIPLGKSIDTYIYIFHLGFDPTNSDDARDASGGRAFL